MKSAFKGNILDGKRGIDEHLNGERHAKLHYIACHTGSNLLEEERAEIMRI